MLRVGEGIDDRYRIEERIGHGGMGMVFRARDLREGETVAVKVLTLPHGESSLRFRREFRVMSRLHHPNVVRVMDSGKYQGDTYLVMEYVPDGTLTSRYPEPPNDEAELAARLDLLAGVADALAYVHAEGVIHRDLKPDNVLIRDGKPVLMDFGLAKSAQGSKTAALTQVGDVLGTAAYMSPEQVRGRDVDHRSDLYAFGCLLHWAITGEAPFDGDNFTEVVIRHLNDPPSPPSARLALVPPRLDALVLTLLEKQAADRYATASDVASRLRAIVAELRGETGRGAAPEMVEPDAIDVSAESTAPADGVYSSVWKRETRDTTPANLLRPPLIGRDKEWAALVAALEPDADDEPVLIEAEVGMGSSRLLSDLANEAAGRDVRVLRVRSAKGVNVAYEGWNQALARLWKTEPAVFARSAEGVEDALALLVPEAFPGATPLALPADVAQLRLYEAVDLFCARLLERGRVLLLIDDLHAADEGSVLLMRHLARGVVRRGARMIASVETSEAPKATREAVRHLEARRIELAALEDDAAGQLVRGFLGGDVDPQLERHVVRRSGGNPFFVHELLQALLNEGHISRRAESWVWSRNVPDLPASIEGVFGQRIENLGGETRAIACAAATIGLAFPFETLQELLGADEDDLLDALDELVRAGIVREQRGDAYAFVHPLLRDILQDTLASRRRRRYHAKLAEMLEAEGKAAFEVLAQHYAEAEQAEPAARYALEAARAAERVFANDLAERFYRLVLEVYDDVGDADEAGTAEGEEAEAVSEARLALARVLDLIGRWDEAEELFLAAREKPATRVEALRGYARHLGRRGRLEEGEQAVRVSLEIDPDDVGTWRDLGSLLTFRSDFAGAREALHTALAGLTAQESPDRHELALTQLELASLAQRNDDFEEAIEWGQVALATLSDVADPILAARIDQVFGLVHYSQGRLKEAERHFAKANEGFRAAGDASRALMSQYNLGMVLEERGAMQEAAATFEDVRERAYRFGDARNEASAAATWGWLLQRQGRFEEAIENLRHARAYFGDHGFEATRRQVHLNLVTTLARAGRTDEARAEWADYLASKRADEQKPYERGIESMTQGELELRCAAYQEAVAMLRETTATFERLEAVQERVESGLLLAEAELAIGDAAKCIEQLDAITPTAQALPDGSWSVEIAFLRALAEGRDEVADALADEMAELELQSSERWLRSSAAAGRS